MGDPRPDDRQATTLALAAGAGDLDALATFIRITQRDVYRFLSHVGERTEAEAENLTHETYLRALQALPVFAGRSSARTWLLAIARRVAADQIRRRSTRPRVPAHRRPGFDEGLLLRELVAGLDADRRDAFVLTQVVGLDYAAAAEVCGCTVGTIRSRVARAREDLIHATNAPGTHRRKATGR